MSTRCLRDLGRMACVGQRDRSDELCNGLDDDCDGMVDEVRNLMGEGGLCPMQEASAKGRSKLVSTVSGSVGRQSTVRITKR